MMRTEARGHGGTVLRALVVSVPLCLGATVAALAQCPDGTPPPCRGARPAAVSLPAVAVLTFESRSRDSGDAYLAEGVSDEITTRLARLGQLHVRSESAARAFRVGSQAPAAIARALNVEYLVTGSIRRAGPTIRVSVELARAATGERVWGEQYDRSSEDVLRVEDEIAAAVAVAIAGRLAPSDRGRLRRRETAVPAAYDHYLRGLFQLRRRSPDAMDAAWREFAAAVALDPNFADAHAQLGAVGNIAGSGGQILGGMPPETTLVRGERETETALRLDSTSAQAWANLATLRALHFPTTYAGVREAVDRSLALDSTRDQICYVAANHYARLGDILRAAGLFRRAREADPLNGTTLNLLIFATWFLGSHREALALADTLVLLDPTGRAFGLRAGFRLAAGDTAGARADLVVADSLGGPRAQGEWVVRLQLGDSAGSGRYVDSLRAGFERTHGVYRFGIPLAGALLARGDRAAALDVLERARPREINAGFVMGHTLLFLAVRDEPRFRALLTEMAPPPVPR